MEVYRHGDVLIARVEEIPEQARERGDLVLARGEATGHAHRVETDGFAQILEFDADLFLRVAEVPARVLHEEHDPIELPPGTYKVWRQREYDPATDERIVVD